MSANTKGKVATLWYCIRKDGYTFTVIGGWIRVGQSVQKASQKSRVEVRVRSKALSADEIAADILKASLSTSTPVDFAG